jgi:hypothetical protein
MQNRKEKKGFDQEKKKMMSIWHKVQWKKQEGHNRKKFLLLLHSTIATLVFIAYKVFKNTFRTPITVEEIINLGVNFSQKRKKWDKPFGHKQHKCKWIWNKNK